MCRLIPRLLRRVLRRIGLLVGWRRGLLPLLLWRHVLRRAHGLNAHPLGIHQILEKLRNRATAKSAELVGIRTDLWMNGEIQFSTKLLVGYRSRHNLIARLFFLIGNKVIAYLLFLLANCGTGGMCLKATTDKGGKLISIEWG